MRFAGSIDEPAWVRESPVLAGTAVLSARAACTPKLRGLFLVQPLPPDACQPDILRNRLASAAVVGNHAAAQSQGFGGIVQSELVAVHPAEKHFVRWLTHLFARPGIDIVRAEFAVFPLDAGSAAGGTGFG